MKQKNKDWWAALDKRIRRFLVTVITILVAMGAYNLWIHMSSLSGTETTIFYGFMKATAGVSYLRVVDDFIYYRIDTEKLLSEDPKAYAIYMLAYGVVIGRAFGV